MPTSVQSRNRAGGKGSKRSTYPRDFQRARKKPKDHRSAETTLDTHAHNPQQKGKDYLKSHFLRNGA